MILDHREIAPLPLWTAADEKAFTHVVYLRVPSETIAQRRASDTAKSRPALATQDIQGWQQQEILQLRQICYRAGIPFTVIDDRTQLLRRLTDFQVHGESINTKWAERALDNVFEPLEHRLHTVLVFDGDKTLIEQDSGQVFFNHINDGQRALSDVFARAGYTYAAFRQATILYEDVADDQELDAICCKVAAFSNICPEIYSLLRRLGDQDQVGIVIITSGIRLVFEKVLERYDLHQRVKIIGGSRLADGHVVTPEVKRALVARLQDKYGCKIWAFGDSPLDLPMLRQADEAIIVVGDDKTRSRSMDVKLKSEIETNGLKARQLLCSSTSAPRLDIESLPIVQSDDIATNFLDRNRMEIFDATSKAAAVLLSTTMRDAGNIGPALRASHYRAGSYLAIEYLSQILGLEEHPIQHVQGYSAVGYRLRDEARTCIIAIMRGGEPMAFGVNEVFPSAMFKHANQPEDISPEDLEGMSTVLLVDAVINTGKTMVEFVRHVKDLYPALHIVVVAGTVRRNAIENDGSLVKSLEAYSGVSLVTLRVSTNRYTGTKNTDTGNRLFNSTHLD